MTIEKNILVANRLKNVRFYIFCILVAFISISKAAIEITFGLVLFLWIIENALVKKWKIREYFPKTKLNLPIAILTAVLFLSIFNSVVFDLSLRKFFSKWVQYILLYFLTVSIIDSRKKIKVVLSIFSISLTVVLINGLWQAATGIDFLYSQPIEGFWIRGHFCGLNPFGGLIILLSPIVTSFLFTKKGVAKIFGFFIFGIAITCLILSCSVISWIAGIMALVIALFFSGRKKIIKIIPVLILLSLLVIFSLPAFKTRISEAVYNSVYSHAGRIAIWKEYLQEITINPILGKGLSTTNVQIAEKYSQLPLVIRANPHSWYLLIALEAGLLGLIAYLWFLRRVFRVFFSSKKDLLWYGLFVGFLSFVLVNIADNIWDDRIQSLFWVIVGLVVVHSKMLTGKND